MQGMQTLFLAHPVSFVLVVVIAALGLQAAASRVSRTLFRLGALEVQRRHIEHYHRDPAVVAADVAASAPFDLSALERIRERRQIAAIMISSWTQPHRDMNGDVHHEAIDPVLVAKAYDAADVILDNAKRTPAEILIAAAPPEPMTFSELASSLSSSGVVTNIEREQVTS